MAFSGSRFVEKKLNRIINKRSTYGVPEDHTLSSLLQPLLQRSIIEMNFKNCLIGIELG
jgi:hypothetical protein